MADTPRVSVVIPTYQRPQALLRAIDSALAQTFAGFELLVVDDASRDGTRAAVERVTDPRLRYVRLDERHGPAQTRNVGAERAIGEWIAFLDDDDEWLPEYLAEQLDRIASLDTKVAAVFSLVHKTRAADSRVFPSPADAPSGTIAGDELTRAVLTAAFAPTMSAWVVRRDVLLELGGLDAANPSMHDIDLWLRMAQAGQRVAATPKPLVTWHDWGVDRVSTDSAARERGLERLLARWQPVMVETLGTVGFERWVDERRGKAHRLHRRHIDHLIATGSRAGAWRYVRAMAPRLPWGARDVLRALAFAITGRRQQPKRARPDEVSAASRD